MLSLPTVTRTRIVASAKSSNMNVDAMTAILPPGSLHRETPKNKAASAARNMIPTTRVKSGIPKSRRVWWSYVITMLRWWFD